MSACFLAHLNPPTFDPENILPHTLSLQAVNITEIKMCGNKYVETVMVPACDGLI